MEPERLVTVAKNLRALAVAQLEKLEESSTTSARPPSPLPPSFATRFRSPHSRDNPKVFLHPLLHLGHQRTMAETCAAHPFPICGSEQRPAHGLHSDPDTVQSNPRPLRGSAGLNASHATCGGGSWLKRPRAWVGQAALLASSPGWRIRWRWGLIMGACDWPCIHRFAVKGSLMGFAGGRV